MKLSFEVLEALDAIDRTGTFTGAAELLHRVPSSVTYLVQKLEKDLALQLFDRGGRRVKLTSTGRVVLEGGRRLLSAAGQLELDAKRAQEGWESELRICLDEILPFEAMWRYIHEFSKLKMSTRLRFSREVLGGTWEALLTNRADLVIGAAGDAPHFSNIVTRPIGTLSHVFVVAPHHPLASAPEPLSLDTVMKYQAAVISDTSREQEPLAVAFDAAQSYIAVPTLADKLDAQREGLAVGTLPVCKARRSIRDGSLVPKRVAGMRELTHCHLAWRENEDGRALQWWIEQLDRPDLIESFIEYI